jgi:hypothetical protein
MRNENGGYLVVVKERVINKYVESDFYCGFKLDLTMWNVVWREDLL